MAISYVGGKVAGRANPSSAVSIAIDSGLTGGSGSAALAGDLVIVCAVTGSAAGNPAMAVTTPADYTPIGQLNEASVTADTSLNVSYKIMPATPDTAVTIPGTTNNAWGEAYSIQVFRGVDPVSPLDVSAVPAQGTATTRCDPASIDWSSAGTWVVICGGGAAGTGANYVAPANYTTNFLTAFGADSTDALVGSGYNASPSDPENPAVYTGGTVVASASWCSYTLALKAAAEAVSVGIGGNGGSGGLGSLAAAVVLALSGVVGTGSVGTLAPSASVAITGQAGTGAVGTIVPSASFAAGLTGQAGTGAAGSVAAGVSVPLTGEAGAGAVGTLAPSSGINVALGGNAGTGAVGNVSVSVAKVIQGQAGTGSVGTLSPSVARALQGNAGTGSTGTLSVTVSRALSGNAGTGAVGTLVPSAGFSVAVTGTQGTGSTGTVAAKVSAPLSGNAGTGAVGTLVPTAGFVAALFGSAATGSVESLSVSASLALSGAEGTGTAGSLSPALVVALAGNAAAGDVGTVSVGGPHLLAAQWLLVPAETYRVLHVPIGNPRMSVAAEDRTTEEA